MEKKKTIERIQCRFDVSPRQQLRSEMATNEDCRILLRKMEAMHADIHKMDDTLTEWLEAKKRYWGKVDWL